MATISHTSQISRQATSGYSGDGKNGWDSKLNSLLEDLHGTVIPGTAGGKDGRAAEYREYRMTSSTRNNDEPPSTTEEKWIEYGTAHQPPYLTELQSRQLPITQSSSSSRLIDSSSRSNYSRNESNFGQTHSHSHSQMEFMDPVNTTVSLRSGQTSPLPPFRPSGTGTSPKVEKKEFYSKQSYTTLIKGPQPSPDYILKDHIGPELYPINRNESSSEFSRETTSNRYALQEPVYTTPPKVAKPETNPGLKTPPLVRKILQQSESFGSHKHSSYNREREHIPTYDINESYDERNRNAKYYTSTTTRTETREGTDNIIRRFPSQTNLAMSSEPPKRLDDLLATFDESYIETSRIVGDGGGPHGSHPYGPGTRAIEQPQRSVRIDESRNVETEISRRNISQNNNVETRNVTGPPVYYPVREDQVFKGERVESEAMKGKGKAKAKMEQSYKAKEKSKSSHSEKGGGGALPVPVCLPVCCAAPCVIM